MGGTSTIPAVRAYLTGPSGLFTTATFPQAAGDDVVQVSYGYPTDVNRDCVWVGGTAQWDQDFAVIGPSDNPRDEKYTLELFVTANAPGRTQKSAVERAFDVLAVLETVLRPTPPAPSILPVPGLPAGSQVLSIDTQFHEQVDGEAQEGRGALIHAGVRIQARV